MSPRRSVGDLIAAGQPDPPPLPHRDPPPAQPDTQEASPEPGGAPGRRAGQAPGRAPRRQAIRQAGQAPARTRGRAPARESTPGPVPAVALATWRRVVEVEARRYAAAVRELERRDADLGAALAAALDGGAPPGEVRSWLAVNGVTGYPGLPE